MKKVVYVHVNMLVNINTILWNVVYSHVEHEQQQKFLCTIPTTHRGRWNVHRETWVPRPLAAWGSAELHVHS